MRMLLIKSALRRERAFSLVEVTIALGIFAFVVVGILGLLPAGMRMRSDSAAETRGILISEELFASVRSSPSVTATRLRDGPKLTSNNVVNPAADLTRGPVVVGYPSRTTVPFGLWHSSRGNNPDGLWQTGQLPGWAAENAIDTLARMTATNVGNGLYRVTVEVRGPASVPLANSRPSTFTTLIYSP